MEGWCVEGWCVEGWCVEEHVLHVHTHQLANQVIEQTRVEVHQTPYVGFCASTGLSLSRLLFIHVFMEQT